MVSDIGILSGSGKVGAAGDAGRAGGAGGAGRASGAGRGAGCEQCGSQPPALDVVCIYCTATQNELNLPAQTLRAHAIIIARNEKDGAL